MRKRGRTVSNGGTGDPPAVKPPAAPEPATGEPRWVGFIDRIDRASIVGWGFDRDNPDRSVAVEAIASNGRRTVVIASLFRRDVAEAGHGNGNHGFEVDLDTLDATDDTTIDIRFLDSKVAISKTPISLDAQRAILAYPMPDSFAAMARRMVLEVRARHAEIAAGDVR